MWGKKAARATKPLRQNHKPTLPKSPHESIQFRCFQKAVNQSNLKAHPNKRPHTRPFEQILFRSAEISKATANQNHSKPTKNQCSLVMLAAGWVIRNF